MTMSLVEYQRVKEFEAPTAHEYLWPLKVGVPVVLKINDSKMRKKTRVAEPMMFITPSQNFHLGDGSLIVAITGFGCEVVPIDDIKPMAFYWAGLSMKASKLLSSELRKLFYE